MFASGRFLGGFGNLPAIERVFPNDFQTYSPGWTAGAPERLRPRLIRARRAYRSDVRTPCPNCGSLRRDATGQPPTVSAVARVHPVSVTVGTIVEHDIAMPLTLGMPAPTIDVEPIVVVNVEWQRGPRMWFAMAWLGENLIGMAPGHSRRAALYAVGKDIDEWFGVVRLLPALDAPQSINLSWMGPRPARPR